MRSRMNKLIFEIKFERFANSISINAIFNEMRTNITHSLTILNTDIHYLSDETFAFNVINRQKISITRYFDDSKISLF